MTTSLKSTVQYTHECPLLIRGRQNIVVLSKSDKERSQNISFTTADQIEGMQNSFEFDEKDN